MPEASVGIGKKGAMPEPVIPFSLRHAKSQWDGGAYRDLDTGRTFPCWPRDIVNQDNERHCDRLPREGSGPIEDVDEEWDLERMRRGQGRGSAEHQ
jgi:hypothetical protein